MAGDEPAWKSAANPTSEDSTLAAALRREVRAATFDLAFPEYGAGQQTRQGLR